VSRRLVLSMFASLDGYIEGPGKQFIGPAWSDELQDWSEEVTGSAGALLFGRVCYQGMLEYWPAAELDPEASGRNRAFARLMNTVPKHVFSRSLAEVTWNATLERGELGETLRRLKAQPGRDLVCFGGAQLFQAALATGLADEVRVLLLPTLFGGGTRLFGQDQRRELERVQVKPLDTGAVSLVYQVRA
jgi:dihydrofolate reductase